MRWNPNPASHNGGATDGGGARALGHRKDGGVERRLQEGPSAPEEAAGVLQPRVDPNAEVPERQRLLQR